MKKQSSVRKNRVEPHVINKTEIDSSSTSGVNFDKMERLREEKDFDANDTTYIKPITDKDTVAIDINAMIRANSGTRSPETHIPEDKQETFNNPAKRVLLSSFRNLNSFKGAITGIVGVNLGQYSNINGSNSISGGVEFDSQSSIVRYLILGLFNVSLTCFCRHLILIYLESNHFDGRKITRLEK